MDNRGMIRALGHAHRQKILRTLEKQPMAYSDLLERVEPERKGRGRFNYHLKVLKDAGLIDVGGAHYRLTPGGEAAARLLVHASRKVVPPPRRRTQLIIIGSLVGIGGVGLLLLLSIVLAPVVLEAPTTAGELGWNIPEFVSGRAHAVGSPQVAVDPDGNAIAIWVQDDGVRGNIWANRFVTGVGWGIPTLIEKDDSGDARAPMLALNPAGNAWAVWQQIAAPPGSEVSPVSLAGYNIWGNRFVPETGWGEARLIKAEALVGDIALDASGALTVAWNSIGVDIWSDRFVSDIGWAGAAQIAGQLRSPGVRLAVDAAGRGMAVWFDEGVPEQTLDGGLYASRYTPNEGWVELNRDPLPAYEFRREVVGQGGIGIGNHYSIAMNSDGHAIVTWHRDTGDTAGIYASFFLRGFGWDDAVPIGLDVGGFVNRPQVAVDAKGNGIAVWSQSGPSEVWVDLFASGYQFGVGWGDPGRIAEKVGTKTDPGNFALAMGPAGSAALLYDDKNNGISAIRYRPGEGWSVPTLIDPGATRCGPCSPAVAVDATGNAIAVWEERESRPLGILASRFEEPTPLDELIRDTRDRLERNRETSEATLDRMATMTGWLVVSLSLLVATVVLIGVLFVLYWNPRRNLAGYREPTDDSGKPPGPGG